MYRLVSSVRKLCVPLGPADDYEYVTDHYLQVSVRTITDSKHHSVKWRYRTVDEGAPGCGDTIDSEISGLVVVPFGKEFKQVATIAALYEKIDMACEGKKAERNVFCHGQFPHIVDRISGVIVGLNYQVLCDPIIPVSSIDDIIWDYYWPKYFNKQKI